MNNKINDRIIYGIIYGIIFLCILCIILVSVLSTGNKEWDWGLGIFSVVGIIASGVYLIRKNKKTAKVAPVPNPNSSLGAADDKNLDQVIYNKIKEDRYSAIINNFHNEFRKKYVVDDDKFTDFRNITKAYVNNKLSIENYFNKILPLFNYTKNNEDELKKNIIKYVVLSYFPKYNKELVDLYIKDKIKEYVDELLEREKEYHKPEITIVQLMDENTVQKELKDAYSELENDKKEILIDYIKELLQDVKESDVVNQIIKKITVPLSYDSNFMRT